MKVKIGPYIEFIGIFQIFDKLKWFGVSEDRCHKMAEAVDDRLPFISDFLIWLDSKRNRKIKVILDNYDHWSFRDSLSPIIYAMLVDLKTHRNGWPSKFESDEEWDIILDKMIWSFQELQRDWESDYYKENDSLINFRTKREDKPGKSDFFKRMMLEQGQILYDRQGEAIHREKIQEGLELFGTHFLDLWD